MTGLDKSKERKIRGGYVLPKDYRKEVLLVEGDDILKCKDIKEIYGTYLSYAFDDIRLQSLFGEQFIQVNEPITETKQAMEIIKTYVSENHILNIITTLKLSDEHTHALIRVLKREEGCRIRDIIAVGNENDLINFIKDCSYTSEKLPKTELIENESFEDLIAYKINQPGFNYEFHIIKLNEIV